MTKRPFFTPIENQSQPSLEGTTLIIPAVSIGSVPQLSIDLLLHHPELNLVKVGRIDPSFCFPFVGPSDSTNGSDDVTTALEGTLSFLLPLATLAFCVHILTSVSCVTQYFLTDPLQ